MRLIHIVSLLVSASLVQSFLQSHQFVCGSSNSLDFRSQGGKDEEVVIKPDRDPKLSIAGLIAGFIVHKTYYSQYFEAFSRVADCQLACNIVIKNGANYKLDNASLTYRALKFLSNIANEKGNLSLHENLFMQT